MSCAIQMLSSGASDLAELQQTQGGGQSQGSERTAVPKKMKEVPLEVVKLSPHRSQ